MSSDLDYPSDAAKEAKLNTLDYQSAESKRKAALDELDQAQFSFVSFSGFSYLCFKQANISFSCLLQVVPHQNLYRRWSRFLY